MRLLNGLVALAFAALCGCSSFSYEWRQAMKQPVSANDIAGPWEGSWLSHANGHNDKLRALITRADTNHYNVKFHAAYKKWITIHFNYTVRMEVEPSTNGFVFHGMEDLGKLAGGVYRYEGEADSTNFFSTYNSKYDRGIFQMKRPVPPGTIPVYSAPDAR